MPLHYITGNLLTCDAQYIAHQCNCVANKPHGLSQSIFDAFPYANIYAARAKGERGVPGTISIHGEDDQGGLGPGSRKVINMLSQYYTGKGGRFPNDSFELRQGWFQQCLDRISQIRGLTSIAFPKFVGCGLAGGDWTKYENMIKKFSENNPDVAVYIIGLSS